MCKTSRLRRMIEEDPTHPRYIRNGLGTGLCLLYLMERAYHNEKAEAFTPNKAHSLSISGYLITFF